VRLADKSKGHFICCSSFNGLKSKQGEAYSELPNSSCNWKWCHRCTSTFKSQAALDRHLKNVECLARGAPSRVSLPSGAKGVPTVQFKSVQDLHSHPLVAYADFEMATSEKDRKDRRHQNEVVSGCFSTVGVLPSFEMMCKDAGGRDPTELVIERLLHYAYSYLNIPPLHRIGLRRKTRLTRRPGAATPASNHSGSRSGRESGTTTTIPGSTVERPATTAI
jgi:hypothetical protein